MGYVGAVVGALSAGYGIFEGERGNKHARGARRRQESAQQQQQITAGAAVRKEQLAMENATPDMPDVTQILQMQQEDQATSPRRRSNLSGGVRADQLRLGNTRLGQSK